MLADDLVGLAESQEELQKMADTIHAYSRKWRFKLSPTKKSVVVVFGPLPPNKESPKVSFSSENLPVLDAYTYLGIVFTSDCKWDAHIAGMIDPLCLDPSDGVFGRFDLAALCGCHTLNVCCCC